MNTKTAEVTVSMTEIRTIKSEPSKFEVYAVDYEHPNRAALTITVERRDRIRWAVCYQGMCLSTDGKWEFEPSPSHRTEEWLKKFRFDFLTAHHHACQWARRITEEAGL